ncbi:DUF1467 family protein [Methyloceanibacter caenitepidi]|uniref:DUF1467 family protein n=1 Tax=Methyloceanibacter caenitepidi TaxID=1384459 RepID=A0A0A8K3K4_9HYPH|nr:DUF1467 family protein [Methyloceanibacter caenitepidi]BAQ17528.1 hypothetical protein GL4_2085 [Methyloceanibacter caenitepidi]
MSLAFGVAIYFVIWWVLLFAVLPWGVRTSEEAGEASNPGFADSAPHRPRLLLKIVATTIVSGIVFAFIYAIMVHHIIRLDDIPFFPRYERVQEAPHAN